MYDPLVVDTFVRAYSEIAPTAIHAAEETRHVVNASGLVAPDTEHPAPLTHIRASASETTLLDMCDRDIGRAQSVAVALQAAAQCLRALTPASVFCLFEYNSAADILICHCASGDKQRLLEGLTIKMGERVTGWSAANRRTSVNSDASLDLAQIAGYFDPPLRSTISTPLAEKERLIGTLTAYSLRNEAFDDSHRYAFERVSSALVNRLSTLPLGSSSNVVLFPLHRN